MRFVYEISCILKGDLGVRRVNVKKKKKKKKKKKFIFVLFMYMCMKLY